MTTSCLSSDYPIRFVAIVHFRLKHNTVMVKKADRAVWGYIDKKGQCIIDPCFGDAGSFVRGLSYASIATGGTNRTVVIDKSGAIVETKHVGIFSEGMAPVVVEGKWGFMNDKREIVVEPRFEDAWFFSEGMAAVRVGERWGFVDHKGHFVVAPVLLSKTPPTFTDGLAAIDGVGEKRYEYINTKGNVVLEVQAEFAGKFQEGMARVKIGNKFGFIDKQGSFVIEPQFDMCSEFLDGIARVEVDSKLGYINRSGSFVWGPQLMTDVE